MIIQGENFLGYVKDMERTDVLRNKGWDEKEKRVRGERDQGQKGTRWPEA